MFCMKASNPLMNFFRSLSCGGKVFNAFSSDYCLKQSFQLHWFLFYTPIVSVYIYAIRYFLVNGGYNSLKLSEYSVGQRNEYVDKKTQNLHIFMVVLCQQIYLNGPIVHFE